MGILLILMSVICSLLLAHLLKLAEARGYLILNMLSVNYLVAFLTAVGMNAGAGISIIPDFPLWFWLFCAGVGFLFIANFFVLSRSVHLNGLGTSVASMRVSLLIPVLLSILFYREDLSPEKAAGIVLVFLALILLVSARRDVNLKNLRNIGSAGLLLLLFFFSGMTDASLKIYDEEMSHIATDAHLMSAIFLFSLLFGIGAAARRGELVRMSRKEWFFGAAIGIPNLLSSIFLIRAFAFYDASIVYSSVNILIVAGGAALGLLWWKDRLQQREVWGIILAIGAIALLTLS